MKLLVDEAGTLSTKPAAFRRLCVETKLARHGLTSWKPAAFRRLCVETFLSSPKSLKANPSRLQAAVC